MTNVDAITSASNPRIKQLVRLQRKSSERRTAGRFCLEHSRLLRHALDAGFVVVEVYVVEEQLPEADRLLIERSGAPQIHVTEEVLEKIAYRENPGAWVAVLEARHADWSALTDPSVGPVVVCAGLEKPGNVGAVLRSADALGAAAVVIADADADLFNPNAVRASAGAVFSVPVILDTPQVICERLAGLGIRIIAVSPEAASDHLGVDLQPPVALVLGAEDRGLDDFWRDAASACVRVSMSGAVDSLNVSVTAALLMFESRRLKSDG
jgi:TrmH family RNA methyltransferase